MKYDKAELAAFFAKPFDDARWADVLAELFGAREDENGRILKPQPFDRPFPDAKGWYLGSFTTADGYLVGLFRFETDSVRRRRVGLRNLLKPMLKWQHDAALAVFTERGSPAWRFSFVCDLKGEATAAKRFTYVFGDPASPFRTPVQRFLALRDAREEGRPVTFAAMQDAFSVEALSDEFFRAYKEHYGTFVSRVTGKRFVKEGGKWVETAVGRPDRDLYRTFGNDGKRVRDYVKKMLGRLVFLHFLQKKGWLGARKGGWTGGDPAFLLHLFEKADPDQQDDFLDEVLEPLFFNALNTDRSARGDLFDTGVPGIGKCRIPYLNGGLFEKDDLDELRVKFPAAYFRDLLRFFSEYNFTIDENDADEAEVGIDPEMLGRIFENLLEDNKDKGAFYTPKEIVRYMCRRSLLAHLSDGEDQASADAIAAFLDTRDPGPLPKKTAARLAAKLRDVKICDPAIGSGAFPMGLLRELFALRSALDPDADDLKRQIIENNIYGVDIEKGAVDIARLRFWLALVVDADEPVPLPNLDFKIMQGNSLVESWKGHDLSKVAHRKQIGEQFLLLENETDIQRKCLRDLLHRWYSCADHRERARLREAIHASVEKQIRTEMPSFSFGSLDPSANTEFFLWHLWFTEAFDRGGFDIVIGNPPYINVELMPEADKSFYKAHYSCFYKRSDIFALFMEAALQKLASPRGSVAFIIPSAVHSNLSYKPLRALMLDNHWLCEVCYTGGDVFKEPTVDTTILFCKKPDSPQIRLLFARDFAHPSGTVVPAGHFAAFQNIISVERGETASIFAKLLANAAFRAVADDFTVFQGIVTGNNPAFIFDTEEAALGAGIEPALLHPLCHGRDIARYQVRSRERRILYLSKVFDLRKYPGAARWLKPFKAALAKRREAANGVIPWYSLQWPREKAELDLQEKILVQNTRNESLSDRIVATLDNQGVYSTQGINFIIPDTRTVSLRYLLGILNSRLLNFLFRTKFLNLAIKADYLKQVRLPPEDKRIPRLVDRILAAKTRNPEADTTALESEIDTLVYTLYGLTPEEIATVEGGSQ